MLLSLLLVTLLAQNEPIQAAGPPSMATAVQLAAEHRDADALAMFQRLAAINPNDHEARLWIARLHERMGHPGLAEAVYRSVLLEDGGNLDAMLGVGTTLVAQHRAKDAIEILERAESQAPQNADVLDALARAHAQAGDDTRSLDYLRRSLAVAPSEQRQFALERARLAYEHRIEARFYGEQFSGSGPDAYGGDIGVNIRVRDALRVVGRGQAQRKFGITDERGGGGLEWRWNPSTTFTGQVLIGPDNKVLAQGDYLGEIAYARDRATVTATVRYFDFFGATMTVVSPAVAWQVTDRLTVGLLYGLSATDTSLASSIKGHTAHVRGSYAVRPRVRLNLGYAQGIDDFDSLSIDRIGAFRASTESAGLRLDLRSRTALVGTFEAQQRRSGGSMRRVTFNFAQRF